MIAVDWSAPSKFLQLITDIASQIATDQPTWKVETAANISSLPAVLANAANHPTASVPLVVLMKGSRSEASEDPPKGTTQTLWDVVIFGALFIHDDTDATRLATLDGEEVKLANLLHALEATRDFGADARDLRLQSIEPSSSEAEGDIAPFAGSVFSLAAQVWE